MVNIVPLSTPMGKFHQPLTSIEVNRMFSNRDKQKTETFIIFFDVDERILYQIPYSAALQTVFDAPPGLCWSQTCRPFTRVLAPVVIGCMEHCSAMAVTCDAKDSLRQWSGKHA